MTRFLALAVALALPALAAPVPARAQDLADSMVDLHNRVRDEAGTPPVAWDADLAAQARDWADHLADIGRLEHSDGPDGENLAGGQGDFSPADLARLWVGERADFVDGAMPDISRTGNWADAGHYSQMIWRGTARIGCATSGGAGGSYLVCRYAPAGNVMGETAR